MADIVHLELTGKWAPWRRADLIIETNPGYLFVSTRACSMKTYMRNVTYQMELGKVTNDINTVTCLECMSFIIPPTDIPGKLVFIRE